jgi:hypothetical protein
MTPTVTPTNTVTPTVTSTVTPTTTPNYGILEIQATMDPSYSPQSYRLYYAFLPNFDGTQPYPLGASWNLLSVRTLQPCTTLVSFGTISVPVGNVVYFQLRENFSGTFIYETDGIGFGGDPCSSPSVNTLYTHSFSVGSPGIIFGSYNLKLNWPPSAQPAP